MLFTVILHKNTLENTNITNKHGKARYHNFGSNNSKVISFNPKMYQHFLRIHNDFEGTVYQIYSWSSPKGEWMKNKIPHVFDLSTSQMDS